MAEPQRAHVAAPRLPGARFLIVEARYYEFVAVLSHSSRNRWPNRSAPMPPRPACRGRVF